MGLGKKVMTHPLDIVLVGCGAIAQRGYLPALNRVPEVQCLWLVDVNRPLAETLARRFGIPKATDDYLSALEQVEAVILAVPNHLHARMALDALNRKRAVLCEKPVGRNAGEVQEMVAASVGTGVPLVAAMIFRQYGGLQQIQASFPWYTLGRIREIRASYGHPLDWPVSSPSFYNREMAGGGVLLDLGVHFIDALFWVLSVEDASVTEYCDDAESGLETEAKIRLTVRVPERKERVPCLLEVSRLRRLRNCMEVFGEKASILIPLSSTATPHLREHDTSKPALFHPVPPRSETECFGEQMKAFARRVRGLEANCATAESQVHVHKVIASCYAARKPLAFSWQNYEPWH